MSFERLAGDGAHRKHLAQMPVSHGVGGVGIQPVAIALQLGSDDRLDASFTRQREEFDGSVKVWIGDRQRLDAALHRRLDDRGDGKRRVEKAIVALDVQRHVVAHCS